MKVTFLVSGERQVQDHFDRFVRRVGAPKAAFLEVAALIAAQDKKQWGAGHALADGTVEQKQRDPERYGPPDRRLFKTGRMYDELTNVEKGIRHLSDFEMRFGTTAWYAKFSQGTKHEPRRGALRFTAKTKGAALAIVERHIFSEHN